MAIFNCYVQLPEGKCLTSWHPRKCLPHLTPCLHFDYVHVFSYVELALACAHHSFAEQEAPFLNMKTSTYTVAHMN